MPAPTMHTSVVRSPVSLGCTGVFWVAIHNETLSSTPLFMLILRKVSRELRQTVCRRPAANSFHEPPAVLVCAQGGMPLVAVVNGVHLVDVVEVAHDVCCAERLARLDRLAVDFLDHHDDPA